MTLEDIKTMDREMLTPAIVAEVINGDAQKIRMQARERPELLGFPVIVYGSRVKIPRRAFIRYMDGDLISNQK